MVITISREFGSGGRELGKRLAEALGIPCYDNEIIHIVANQGGFDSNYASHVSETSIRPYYLATIAHRMSPVINKDTQMRIDLSSAQMRIIKGFASEGDCVIVGRSADVILSSYKPLNIFVYASEDAKIERCKKRMREGENLSVKDIRTKMKEIDRQRANQRKDFSFTKWGAKENYHLCINTTGMDIKEMIPSLAALVRSWFEHSKE